LSIDIGLNGIQVKPGSNRTLEFSFNVKSWFGGPAYLTGLEGQLLYNNFTLSDQIRLTSHQIQSGALLSLDKDSNLFGKFETNISNEAIKYIEENRKDGDIQFTIKIIYRWQKILNAEKFDFQSIRDGNVPVGPIRWNEATPFITVARSTWVQLLKQLKYSEIELFEVNKLSFSEDENLKQAFEFLREAETQLRSGNHDGVLADCKLAFESAAKYAANGKTQKGFELILEKVFPEHKDKQKPFNEIIQSISDFSQFGRHAGYPHIPISRDEAEFIYIATLDVFSFISRRLK
jgi:hypothetical protein